MDVVDLIGNLAKLGKDKDGIEDILGLLDVDLNDKKITSALANIGTQTLNLTSIFQNFGQTASNAFKGLGTLIASNWKLLTAIVAIGAVVGITNAIIKAPQKATERMTESFGEFENAQGEVEALNSELQKTKDSIADLQAKGNLSLVDKEELRNLRETEKSLEMQKDIAEELAASKAEQAAQSAAVAYNKNFAHEVSQATINEDKNWIAAQKEYNGGFLSDGIVAAERDISAQIALLQEYKTQRDAVASDTSAWTDWNNKVNNTTDSLWEQADALIEQKTILEESKKAIEDNGGRLTPYQKLALDNITSSLDYIYKELSPETWKQMKIDDIFATDKFANTKQELVELAKGYDNLTNFIFDATLAYEDLNSALPDGVSMADIAENIFAEAGIIDTETIRQKLKETFPDSDWADTLSKEDLKLVYKIMLDTETANYDLATWKNTLEEYKAMQALDHGVDISVEQEGLEKVTTAISENASEVGLLDESINSLKSRYKALKDFDADKLFEQTANGIRLNAEYLNQMETDYATDNIIKLNDALKVAAQKAKDAQIAMESNSDPKFADAYRIRYENAVDEVKAIQQLITQYNALNGAYAKAMKAAESANGGVMRDNVKTLWDNAKELKKVGKVGTDDFQSFVELMTGKDYDGKIMDMVNDFDKLNNKIKVMNNGVQKGTLGQSIASFFVDGKQGALNFINAIKQAGKLYDGSEWVEQDGNELSFKVDTTSLSEALGISEELVFILMENLRDYGFDIDIEQGTESVNELIEQAETLSSKLKEAGINIPPINLEINSDEIEGEIKKIQDWIKGLNPELDEYGDLQQYGKTALKAYYAKEQELNGERFNLDDVDDGYKTVASKWNEAKDALAEYNATVDTYGENSKQANSAQEQLQTAIDNFNTSAENSDIEFRIEDGEIKEVAKQLDDIATDKVDITLINESATEKLDAIQITIDEIRNTPIVLNLEINDALIKVEELRQAILSLNSNISINPNGNNGGEGNSSETYSVVVEPATTDLGSDFTGNGIINVKPDTTDLGDGFTGKATIIVKPDTYDLGSDFHGTGTVSVSGQSPATGTAFARGDWRIGSDGVALGGELGKEIVVRNGKFFTIGENGAEFFRHKKGDIIFNAAQTKSLFKYGGIKGANPRGKVYGSGSAFATGNAFSGSSTISGSTSKDLWDWLNGGSNTSSDSNTVFVDASEANSIGYHTEAEFFDWIEILIDRIERAIEHFEKKVDNVFDSWENRGKALNNQSDLIRRELETQQQAYEYYLRYIDEIGKGLDQKYIDRIHDGTMKVSIDYDEELKAQIEDYQEFYEKALECKAAIDDLTISLSECYQIAFDNVITRYDQLVAITEHSQAMLDASISQSEAKGYLISQEYYEAQIANEQKLIEQQKEKREELIKTRDTALMNGVIVEGSEAWMDMNAEIDACTEAIAESNTAIIEFNNSIQEINWEIFDLLQEKISNVSNEAEFLIDLLSNDKLFDDKGQMTSEGLVTLGLYGQRYNTYLAQAAMYADELAKINSQIEDDSNNQTLIERRQELLELQQDSILAAEDEKQAIADLISDGIDKQLESLQELIDTYNDALDAQKDLYDYQKKVVEQTKNITQLEKQLAVYQGSDSEEIQAKIQEIKVSLEEEKSNLEETQYDKFINDQQKLLDELYTEYEDLLNERLDNTDALVEEMIEKINLNSEEISQILSEKADSVGYILSQDMQSIWNGESGTNNILTTYGEGILNATTTVATTLNTINSNLMNMVSQLNSLADMDISAIPVTGAYKDGKKKVVNDENAWTQEDAMEYIVRPSDGAILTPVAQDDSILDSNASGNIWKMANNPSKFIRDNLKTGIVSAPVSGDKNTTVTQNFEKVVFDMPNVTNYSEMIEAMKRDKNFERLIVAFTTDQLAGKSSMRVTKSF